MGVRPFVDFISGLNRKQLVGVEIGVYKGENAVRMLNELDIAKLYLIDPYLMYEGFSQAGWRLRNQDTLNSYHDIMIERIQPYKDKVIIIKEKSSEAVDKIPYELDFVYIDGNHDYEYVKKDIELYYPKIKQGGIIGGDNLEYSGVHQAVIELLKKGMLIQIAQWAIGVEWWCVKCLQKN